MDLFLQGNYMLTLAQQLLPRRGQPPHWGGQHQKAEKETVVLRHPGQSVPVKAKFQMVGVTDLSHLTAEWILYAGGLLC